MITPSMLLAAFLVSIDWYEHKKTKLNRSYHLRSVVTSRTSRLFSAIFQVYRNVLETARNDVPNACIIVIICLLNVRLRWFLLYPIYTDVRCLKLYGSIILTGVPLPAAHSIVVGGCLEVFTWTLGCSRLNELWFPRSQEAGIELGRVMSAPWSI